MLPLSLSLSCLLGCMTVLVLCLATMPCLSRPSRRRQPALGAARPTLWPQER